MRDSLDAETDTEAGRSPRALPLRKPSPARSLGGSQTMKDRVAAIRAERKGNVSPRASPTPSQDPTQDPAQDSQPTAVDPQLKTATPLEKVASLHLPCDKVNLLIFCISSRPLIPLHKIPGGWL